MFQQHKDTPHWRLTSKGTEPSVSASGSMAMWRHPVGFALYIWQFFYCHSLKPLLMKFFLQLIKYYCHRMIASYLLAVGEKFSYLKLKDGIIAVPWIQLEGGIGFNGDSWGWWIPSPSLFPSGEKHPKKKVPSWEKKTPSWINLFDITVILNKLRDMMSSDLVLFPLAVFSGPSRQWHIWGSSLTHGQRGKHPSQDPAPLLCDTEFFLRLLDLPAAQELGWGFHTSRRHPTFLKPASTEELKPH